MPLSKARNRDRMRQIRLHAVKEEVVVQPKTPLYNPSIHRVGDKVLVYQGKRLMETIIPTLDAGGNPIPDYD